LDAPVCAGFAVILPCDKALIDKSCHILRFTASPKVGQFLKTSSQLRRVRLAVFLRKNLMTVYACQANTQVRRCG
jgi:hypothetical protein